MRDDIIEEKSYESIDGSCHENAIYLCNYFYYHSNYEPYLRWGIFDSNNREYTELKNAEYDGCVHFWVEIPVYDGWIYTDLFTMSSEPDSIERGDVFTSDRLPHTYYTVENTLFKYHPKMEPEDLLSYEDIFILRNDDDVKYI